MGAVRGARTTNRAPIEQPLASHCQYRHNVEREFAFKCTIHPHVFSARTELTTDVAISVLMLRVEENPRILIQTKTAHGVSTYLPYLRIFEFLCLTFASLLSSSLSFHLILQTFLLSPFPSFFYFIILHSFTKYVKPKR